MLSSLTLAGKTVWAPPDQHRFLRVIPFLRLPFILRDLVPRRLEALEALAISEIELEDI
jgi:hypothetical protein